MLESRKTNQKYGPKLEFSESMSLSCYASPLHLSESVNESGAPKLESDYAQCE